MVNLEEESQNAMLDKNTECIKNYQSALLLSLLEKKLLTQNQFDLCMNSLIPAKN
jgi:hypothetical protein